jgi:hypothetical protein
MKLPQLDDYLLRSDVIAAIGLQPPRSGNGGSARTLDELEVTISGLQTPVPPGNTLVHVLITDRRMEDLRFVETVYGLPHLTDAMNTSLGLAARAAHEEMRARQVIADLCGMTIIEVREALRAGAGYPRKS